MIHAAFTIGKAQNTNTELESCFSPSDQLAANEMMIYLQETMLRDASEDLLLTVEESKVENKLLKSES